MYFKTECELAVQGHPRSLISAPIESAYATSYWLSIVTVVLSCPMSEILQVLCSKQRPHPYSTRSLGVCPLDQIADVVALRSEGPTLIIPVRGGSGTSQMERPMGAQFQLGAQYAAELRILLVCLSESLGRLGQNGGSLGHIFHWEPRPPTPPHRTVLIPVINF